MNGVDVVIRGGEALEPNEWDRLKGLHEDAVADARRLVQDVLQQHP